MKWLYHLRVAQRLADEGPDDAYAPASLAAEGFIHCSYRDAVVESARLYFAAFAEERLEVLQIDPRKLEVPIDVAMTPRGPMPHVRGAIPRAAIHATLALSEAAAAPDEVTPLVVDVVAGGDASEPSAS